MSKQYTRRAFLKTTGAAVLAVAAAGALTACGGGGGGGTVNPTPAQPDDGDKTKNTTNVGTLEIKNNGVGGPTNDKFSTDKKYLYLTFSVKNLTDSELTIHKTDFSVEPTIGDGAAGFLTGSLAGGAASLSAEKKIPAGDTVSLFAFFDATGYDLKANSTKVTFKYNGKKIVYTVKYADTGIMGEMPSVTVSEVTNA